MRTNAAHFLRSTAVIGLLTAVTGVFAQDNPPARAKWLPTGAIQNFTDVMQRIHDDAVTPPDDDALMIAATRALLAHVDPEGGEYYTKAEYEDFKTGRHVASVGVELRMRQGQFVLFALDGGPAASAGVRNGDVLRTINGMPVAGLDSHTAFIRLRGDDGSKVVLGIARPDSSTLINVELVRQAIPFPPVTVSRIDSDLAVLRVPPFQVRTLKEIADALNEEWSRRPFKGLVIDLRHNIGGLLESSIGLAAMFLKPDDLVARMSGRIREANQEFHAVPADYNRRNTGPDPVASLPTALRALPLVVLVDESTASGAEIVAAALRDHQRAILVGHITYGRGSIQTLMPLPSGAAMKLTTAYYVTPSGQQLQGRGLQPEVPVASDDEAVALQAALAALRKQI